MMIMMTMLLMMLMMMMMLINDYWWLLMIGDGWWCWWWWFPSFKWREVDTSFAPFPSDPSLISAATDAADRSIRSIQTRHDSLVQVETSNTTKHQILGKVRSKTHDDNYISCIELFHLFLYNVFLSQEIWQKQVIASLFHPMKCHCFVVVSLRFFLGAVWTDTGAAINMSLPKPPSSIANGAGTQWKRWGTMESSGWWIK